MPCCDSLNTPSPRFYAEIFNKTTPKGNFLSIDSSVFNIFTPDDPELPRELVLDRDGQERFRKYLPLDRSFVNTIEDYPYPYVIGGSAGSSLRDAQRLAGPAPAQAEQPHDRAATGKRRSTAPWSSRASSTSSSIRTAGSGTTQIVELIDHAVEKHGKKVKFLTFREAQERLNKNLLAGQPLRDPKTGEDNGVRLARPGQ